MDPQPRSTSILEWVVVVQDLGKGYTLIKVQHRQSDSDQQVWKTIRHQVSGRTIFKRLKAQCSALFTTYVVGIGTIRGATGNYPVQLNSQASVTISRHKPNNLLTAAFRNPTILTDETGISATLKRSGVEPYSSGSYPNGRRAIVVCKVLDKTKIAMLLIALLLVSPALGLLIGIITHNAEVGVAVSAGVFALASFLQGLAAWFHR